LLRGVDLFARYAHAPNALGFCGPSSGIGVSEDEVRAAARRFSGAWPYLQVLARLTGTDDPLDERLVEAYWLGRDLGVDRARFGTELLAVIGPRAGHYWTHLTSELLAGGAPDHGFHVFGVYPWSRLLDRGPEPLHVLDSCRIGWGTVVARHGDEIEVASQRLTWDGTKLDLAPSARRTVGDAEPGDTVALHWDQLCDHLTAEQVQVLESSTRRELSVTSERLARPSGRQHGGFTRVWLE
jgi:Family of unknown function (DUF6390)